MGWRARWWYHNHMALKKTTVMVDADDLELIKQAAAREGRPESEYFREAFHIAAMRTRRWGGQWNIPTFDLGGPIREDGIKQAVADAVAREQAEIDQASRRAPGATA
jgi:Ribbon-helix-helix protein, copG family